MEKLPIVRASLVLTKLDHEDFDRDMVTQRLCIEPTRSAGPGPLGGKPRWGANRIDLSSQPQVRGYWRVDLPDMECASYQEPVDKLQEIFSGRQDVLKRVCREYNLCAELRMRLRRGSFHQMRTYLRPASVAFWAGAGVSIGFRLK